MLVLNLPFKALMFLTLMRPSLVLFLVLWLKLVKDFLKVRCRLALLPFLISCLIWLDLVASLPLIKERKIGRASCRERVEGGGGAGYLEQIDDTHSSVRVNICDR